MAIAIFWKRSTECNCVNHNDRICDVSAEYLNTSLSITFEEIFLRIKGNTLTPTSSAAPSYVTIIHRVLSIWISSTLVTIFISSLSLYCLHSLIYLFWSLLLSSQLLLIYIFKKCIIIVLLMINFV